METLQMCDKLSVISEPPIMSNDILNRLNKFFVNSNNSNNNNNSGIFFDSNETATQTFIKIYGRELNAQEQRYQSQVDQLTIKLAEKQQEVSQLKGQLDAVEEQVVQLVKSSKDIHLQLEATTTCLKEKEDIIQHSKSDLETSKKQKEELEKKLNNLEGEISSARKECGNLKKQLETRTSPLESGETPSQLQQRLHESEAAKQDLEETLKQIEEERDAEIKIAQDALDEAAQEREELLQSFEKELQRLASENETREAQLLEDFEWKLREVEKEHKRRLDEKERKAERVGRRPDDEEHRQTLEKMKSELNSQWEDKLRSECSRLKSELDELHAEEKHLAVESMKLQKDQEVMALKKSFELRQEETAKELSTLKDSLTDKDAYYHKEMDNQRTSADRDIWELRRKLHKLDEASYDQRQQMQEKYEEDMERLREDYEDRLRQLQNRLTATEANGDVDLTAQMERNHKQEMQHLGEQYRLSMERLREELESEKFQAVEEARLIITDHFESLCSSLREQLTEAGTNANQYREESEATRVALTRREEVIRALEEEIEKHKGGVYSSSIVQTSPTSPTAPSMPISSSQFSLASSHDSQRSSTSQDRMSLCEASGVTFDSTDEAQRASGGGLLGKVFGGGWFGPSRSREGSSRRGSVPSNNRKSGSAS